MHVVCDVSSLVTHTRGLGHHKILVLKHSKDDREVSYHAQTPLLLLLLLPDCSIDSLFLLRFDYRLSRQSWRLSDWLRCQEGGTFFADRYRDTT